MPGVNPMIRSILSSLKQIGANVQGIRCKRRRRSMRLCETLPLGERRYLALVEVERQKFLLGTAGNSISLLATLSPAADGPAQPVRVELVKPRHEERWQHDVASAVEAATFNPTECEPWQ